MLWVGYSPPPPPYEPEYGKNMHPAQLSDLLVALFGRVGLYLVHIYYPIICVQNKLSKFFLDKVMRSTDFSKKIFPAP